MVAVLQTEAATVALEIKKAKQGMARAWLVDALLFSSRWRSLMFH
jgi:hypothetical protein